MKKIDIVSMAFGNFKRRKTRSILTVLGVVIGVSSIVVMMSLGVALDKSFTGQLEEMDDLTTISVSPGFDYETGKESGTLDDETIAKMEQIPNVKAVVPLLSLDGKFASGKFVAGTQVYGIKPEHLEPMGITLSEGELTRFFEPGGSTKNIPMIFGTEVPYQFYNPKSRGRGGMRMGGMVIMGGGDEGETRPAPDVLPMAEDTKMKFTFDWSYGEKKDPSDTSAASKPVLYTIDVIGMIESGQFSDKAYSVYVNMDTAKKLKKEQEKQQSNMGMSNGTKSKNKKLTYSSVKVIANNLNDTVAITKQIKDEYGLQAWSSAEAITQLKQMSSLIQMVLGGIGAVSLLVAAIGIANTMIMSIYERTREIGVMKVIGCQLRDIGTLFLCEAGFIGLFGGAAGLILSYGASALLNMVGENAGQMGMGMMGATELSVIPLWLAVAAVTFAIFIGLLAGFLPARRAMKLSALEAMRT